MKHTFTLALCILVALLPLKVVSATTDVSRAVAALVNERSMDNRVLYEAPPLEVLAELRKYANTPKGSFVMLLARVVALTHPARQVQQEAVRLIFDIGTVQPDLILDRHAAQILQSFTRADFTEEMKQVITQAVNRKDVFPEVVLLAGVADTRAAEGRLRELAATGWHDAYYNAHMALARMGDKTELKQCLEITKAKTGGGNVRDLQDWTYICQPETIQALVHVLFGTGIPSNAAKSNKSLPFIWADNAADHLAFIIEGSPLTFKNISEFSEEERVSIMRDWIIRQGGVTQLKIRR